MRKIKMDLLANIARHDSSAGGYAIGAVGGPPSGRCGLPTGTSAMCRGWTPVALRASLPRARGRGAGGESLPQARGCRRPALGPMRAAYRHLSRVPRLNSGRAGGIAPTGMGPWRWGHRTHGPRADAGYLPAPQPGAVAELRSRWGQRSHGYGAVALGHGFLGIWLSFCEVSFLGGVMLSRFFFGRLSP